MEAIHAEPKSIRELFSHWEFTIPDFQRPYTWEEEQCEKLWEDFELFYEEIDTKHPQYFLGSIVLYPEDGNKNRWQIIDGQQRLTTVLLLSKVMHEGASSYKALEKLYKKVNPQTDVITNELRLNLNEQQKNDEEFRAIMMEGRGGVSNESVFAINFDSLQEKFNHWRQGKSSDEVATLIDKWMDSVVLLPIQCNSVDHALTIFNTVNDRGMSLNDADIFKGKIYAAIEGDAERKAFIKQWNNLYEYGVHEDKKSLDHEDLFRIYMHILRAQDGETGKEKALRKYMTDRWAAHPEELRDWQSLMQTLKACRYVHESEYTHEKLKSKETIYWTILLSSPNEYWKYPLYVFLHKHMVEADERETWVLPEEKHAEYLELMRNTVRYFFIKAVVHNSVNAVKDTAYKVCASIENGKDYLAEYEQSLATKDDIKRLEEILHGSNYRRCQRGLVLINSLCNEEQKISTAYANEIWSAEIEHILPRKWNDYDKWDEDLHKQHINLIGNLMPLSKKDNTAASNEFFARKQKSYAKSTIQDALDLSEKLDKKWYPEDVQERHAKAIERLMKFFRG